MKKQLIAGLSVLALFAVADVAAAEKGGGGAPGATTGASPGNDGGANMGAGKESPGASDRGSSPGSSSERGMSSGKGAASEQRSEKGADKGSSKEKSSDRAQSFDKDKSTKGAAKDTDTSKSDRAGKENKDTSSGAASGESGKQGSTTAESRSEPGKSHVSVNQEQRSRVQSAFKSHLGSAGCLSVNASSVLCVSFTRETLTPAPASVDLGDRIQRQFFETLGITRGPDPGIACRMFNT